MSANIQDAMTDVLSTGTRSGNGMFSTVYLMPDGTATKCCDKATRDGWLFYALQCMVETDRAMRGAIKRSPWLPVVHSLTIDWAADKYIANMEQLSEITLGDPENDPEKFYQAQSKHIMLFDMTVNSGRNAALRMDMYRQTNNALFYESGMHDTLCVEDDFHAEHNCMKRANGELVLSDPWCFSRYYDMPDSPELQRSSARAFMKLLAEEDHRELNIKFVGQEFDFVVHTPGIAEEYQCQW